MPLPSPTTTAILADSPDTLSWPRVARLLAAAAVIGAIIGGMG